MRLVKITQKGFYNGMLGDLIREDGEDVLVMIPRLGHCISVKFPKEEVQYMNDMEEVYNG